MATDHRGRTILTRGVGRLGAAVSDAVRWVFSDSRSETASLGTTTTGGERTDVRNDGATGQLLVPEERIVDVIERVGGTMKQSEIVDAVDWSESTVSRKLCDLESRGAVSRYQIGREKLVYLPGHEPPTVESPLARADAD